MGSLCYFITLNSARVMDLIVLNFICYLPWGSCLRLPQRQHNKKINYCLYYLPLDCLHIYIYLELFIMFLIRQLTNVSTYYLDNSTVVGSNILFLDMIEACLHDQDYPACWFMIVYLNQQRLLRYVVVRHIIPCLKFSWEQPCLPLIPAYQGDHIGLIYIIIYFMASSRGI